ncbi:MULTISPECIES: hypothetical protein [unclassified Moorena]|uniref:hypothetical protein n=1 Tax=unclassified Moorena TaxID=2683338 RepID=UPI0013BB52AC|nr:MULTISPECIES: hypothetical protein [unclassified Moorena]NEP36302.1 hypothetical protein [Moorena sp. SIO3B2]NEQ06096.1 hypothetical protein [Moorena sp. SIO4E2]
MGKFKKVLVVFSRSVALNGTVSLLMLIQKTLASSALMPHVRTESRRGMNGGQKL